MKKIFFSSSNAAGAVYRNKQFRKLGYYVISGDANQDAIGKLFSDQFYCLPWQRESNYFDAVFDVIQKEKVDIFVPTGEAECLKASRMRQKFLEMGCTLVAANTRTIEVAIDKAELYNFLSAQTDIPMMKYHVVNSLQDYEEGLEKLRPLNVSIKPAVGSGSRGFVILDDTPMDAMEFFTKKMSFLKISPDYIRGILKNSTNVPKLVLMELLDGVNYDSNMVCKDGEVLFQSVKTREEAKIGTITKGKIIKNAEIEEINKKIARALNTTGLISTQFIGNKIVEINPRWSTTLVYNSVNEYLMSIQVWTGEDFGINPADLETYEGLKMLRYWDIVTYKDTDSVGCD